MTKTYSHSNNLLDLHKANIRMFWLLETENLTVEDRVNFSGDRILLCT